MCVFACTPLPGEYLPLTAVMCLSLSTQVWHDGTEDRVVLICDLWHPDVDLQADILPLLSEAQVEAMRSAQAGDHLALQQRTYSTGESVMRSP